MKTSWTGWVAFLVLAALIGITSCQALTGGAAAAAAPHVMGMAQ